MGSASPAAANSKGHTAENRRFSAVFAPFGSFSGEIKESAQKMWKIFAKTAEEVLKEKTGFVTGFVTSVCYTVNIIQRNRRWSAAVRRTDGAGEGDRGGRTAARKIRYRIFRLCAAKPEEMCRPRAGSRARIDAKANRRKRRDAKPGG